MLLKFIKPRPDQKTTVPVDGLVEIKDSKIEVSEECAAIILEKWKDSPLEVEPMKDTAKKELAEAIDDMKKKELIEMAEAMEKEGWDIDLKSFSKCKAILKMRKSMKDLVSGEIDSISYAEDDEKED